MTDYTDLVRRLRTGYNADGAEAADAIEFLFGEIDAHSELCPLMNREGTMSAEPLLGCATTRQLLEEVKARGEVEPRYREEGDALAIGAANLLDALPGSMLDYRTVDS
jgi:hypothetical protein